MTGRQDVASPSIFASFPPSYTWPVTLQMFGPIAPIGVDYVRIERTEITH